jgi:DNA-binding response OmpR family regulator
MAAPSSGPRKEPAASRVAWASIAVNIVLSLLNLAIAAASGSLAVAAEMVHNLVDLVASVAVLASVKISERESRAFPYGLYKIENVVAVGVALLIFFTGYEIARQALRGEAGPAAAGQARVAVLDLLSRSKYNPGYLLSAARSSPATHSVEPNTAGGSLNLKRSVAGSRHMAKKKDKHKRGDEPSKVLVVEDDLTLLETLEYNLAAEGYEVITAADGLTALEVAREDQPDLIVLDLMLPHLDGFEVCRILRRETSVPILMLTARADEVDRVVGLEVGADDYLTKPFSMRELLARVKALLRRVRLIREEMAGQQAAPGTERLAFGNLVIDLDRREVLVRGESLRLKPQEFELLVFLARHPGMALSRGLLLERVWGWDYGGGSRTVDVHVRWLREKIEADPANPQHIVTVRGVGYCFEA